jgi:hypothetical protein
MTGCNQNQNVACALDLPNLVCTIDGIAVTVGVPANIVGVLQPTPAPSATPAAAAAGLRAEAQAAKAPAQPSCYFSPKDQLVHCKAADGSSVTFAPKDAHAP